MRRAFGYLRIIARHDPHPPGSAMPVPRIYCQFEIADAVQVELGVNAAHHAARVLRLRRGDDVVLFDGKGGDYAASIHEVNRARVLVDVGRHRPDDRESALHVCLAQGLATGDKMDTILQKAVELGAAAFQPIASRRSVVKLTDERSARRAAHWQQVAIAACEQCGRNRLPDVRPVEEVDSWVVHQTGVRLILAPDGAQRFADLPRPGESVTLLVGPEGGFSDAEVTLALAAGFKPVRMGPRILRTETAGLAALAAMQALWGDF